MLRSSTEQLSITGRPDYTQERGSSPPQGREIPVRFESWLFVLLSFWHNIFPPEVGVSHLGKGEENNVFVIFFNQYLSFLEHILREIYLGRIFYLLTFIIFEKGLWKDLAALCSFLPKYRA